MNSRRTRVPGGLYFFTLVTHDRYPWLESPAAVRRFCSGYRTVRLNHPFETLALVILPDHLHAVWRLPADDHDYPLRWRKIKHSFSRGCLAGRVTQSMTRRREKGVWQRRYWEHLIDDDAATEAIIEYVHFNPVKHGVCRAPEEWPWSTVRRAMAKGWHPPGWGQGMLQRQVPGGVGKDP